MGVKLIMIQPLVILTQKLSTNIIEISRLMSNTISQLCVARLGDLIPAHQNLGFLALTLSYPPFVVVQLVPTSFQSGSFLTWPISWLNQLHTYRSEERR